MKTQLSSKGFHLSDRELMKMAKKVGKLATYCKRVKDESSIIHVEAEKRETEKKQDAMKVQINLKLPQQDPMRAESRREDVMEAFERCIEKLEPQIKKYKELRSGKGQRRKYAQQ